MLKKRDIARAHEAREGSIGALAERFHASSTTVQDAIKRTAAEWQASIDLAAASTGTGKQAPRVARPSAWDYTIATLSPSFVGGASKASAYLVQVEGSKKLVTASGPSIVPAVNVLGQDGWEVVHVEKAGEQFTLLLKRPGGAASRESRKG